jgi:hypothetical protein
VQAASGLPLGERRGGPFQQHARELVETNDLDERPDLRLGVAQTDGAPVSPQAPRQHRQVKHQRGVGEREVRQVDDDVSLGPYGPGQRAAAETLSAPVLIARATQPGGFVIKDDDRRNLLNSCRAWQADW